MRRMDFHSRITNCTTYIIIVTTGVFKPHYLRRQRKKKHPNVIYFKIRNL